MSQRPWQCLTGKTRKILIVINMKTRGAKEIRILPISRYSSRKEWEEASWKIIMRSSDVLDALATPNERRDLVMRAAVIEGIRSGKSYREIGDELWCSSQTISSIKKVLHGEKYRSYRERGKTERKKKTYSPSNNKWRQEPRRKNRKAKYTVHPPQLSGISRVSYER